MNYRKPQVVALGPACNRIQGFADKNPYCAPDADHTSSYLSTGGSKRPGRIVRYDPLGGGRALSKRPPLLGLGPAGSYDKQKTLEISDRSAELINPSGSV